MGLPFRWAVSCSLVPFSLCGMGGGGTETPARVVAQVRSGKDICTYGVQFLESDATKDFWGIAFPSVESRGATGQVAEKSGIARRRRDLPSHER
jgi:hypothetical protein